MPKVDFQGLDPRCPGGRPDQKTTCFQARRELVDDESVVH
jgi:hypothetical protein